MTLPTGEQCEVLILQDRSPADYIIRVFPMYRSGSIAGMPPSSTRARAAHSVHMPATAVDLRWIMEAPLQAVKSLPTS